MTIHGSIDHRILGGGSVNTQIPISEAFSALCNFLTSTYAIDSGVERIAYHTGSTGTGLNWWDMPNPVGNNAWAVYRFASASVPFYMMTQWSNGTFGTGSGAPGVLMGSNTNWQDPNGGGIGFSIAVREDGGNPWNGTTNNNGRDTKGTPVWVDGGSRLFVFPRSNNAGGNHFTNKENCIGFLYNKTGDATSIKYSGARIHYLLDENNFLALGDINYDGSYTMFYYGKYDRRPDITSSLPPHVCISTADQVNTPLPQYGVSIIYGSTSGSNPTQEGGIIYPLPGAPGVPYGVRGCSLDLMPNFLGDQRFHPNSGFYEAKYDTYPMMVGLNEAPTFGFLGRMSFFHMCFGLPSHATDVNRLRAVFGNATHATIKMVVPWDGTSSPGQSADRYGRQF